jgi:biotin synthase
MTIRHDWQLSEIREIYQSPLLELVYRAASVHRMFNNSTEVQLCTLLSVKTGGCSEDCAYCPQSARYQTGIKAEKMLSVESVVEAASRAKEAGSSRFCMGAAWRKVRDNKDFQSILEMIEKVSDLGLEVCCTLGMVGEAEAEKLKEAGLYAYNHNIDTSQDYYDKIITTRTFQDRLDTLQNIRKAGISVCCGGIIGLGESEEDRIGMLHTLATLPEHPESVPINSLIAVPGTPLENQKRVSIWEMVRMVATARILMPEAMVRLSAGRVYMSELEQAFCFMAGANSIHTGEKLLTTPNCGLDGDQHLMELLGLQPMASHTAMAPSK